MKKSTILKNVLNRLTLNPESEGIYICNVIKHECDLVGEELDLVFKSVKKNNGKDLINAIQESIQHLEVAELTGVSAWLLAEGHITIEKYTNQYQDDDIAEYRRLWVADMIKQFKAIGE